MSKHKKGLTKKEKVMKNLTSIIILLVTVLMLSNFSCNDNQTPLDKESKTKNDVSAVVIYDGEPAVDGCGWLIQCNQSSYSPINLNSEFQVDKLNVTVSYIILESTWNCGWREPGYRRIEIIKIKKQ